MESKPQTTATRGRESYSAGSGFYLQPGTPVGILPEYCDSPEDASGWRVVEDRGDRVLIEAVGLLAGSAVENPQTLVGREMIFVIGN